MNTITIDLNDYTGFVVTGITTNGKRFRLTYKADKPGFYTAMGINLYRGNVWGIRADNGKRKLLKNVWNIA